MFMTSSIAGKYAGKITLITGGSSGIGLATARRLAREGAQVVITGRSQAELDLAVQRSGMAAMAKATSFLASDDASWITSTGLVAMAA